MRRFITNFSKQQEPLYKICVEKYNLLNYEEILTISDYATCDSGHLPDCSALFSIDCRDLSKFWDLFSAVKKAARFGVY